LLPRRDVIEVADLDFSASLREGKRITVSGWPARDANLKIFGGREVTFEDGSKCIFGGGPSNAWECHTGDCPAATLIPSIVK
jgi:hypothetical protein